MAYQNGWAGSVRNTTAGVELLLSGTLPSEQILRGVIAAQLPSSASIDQCHDVPAPDDSLRRFQILDSDAQGEIAVPMPLDTAVCRECLSETRDPRNRRFGYLLTSCAECGPRYSILMSLPFDRHRTTMRRFELCADCQREYQDPADRRFHAQTISCPWCGPRLWLASNAAKSAADAVRSAVDTICRGGIVAVRGIGGYQLLADATSAAAVGRLRERKHRSAKPFAVMCVSIEAARDIAEFGEREQSLLQSPANPIVLVRSRTSSILAPEVHPDLSDVGILLPTTALHAGLMELANRPLVCTSGNRDGEPLAYSVTEAEQALRNIADDFIHHDREIQHPVDDSVVRVIAGHVVTIRAARGLAPMRLPIEFERKSPFDSFLACGGHQKNAVATSRNGQACIWPHRGDLDSVAAQDRWREQLATEGTEANLESSVVACDAHPGYFSTQWAEPRHASCQRVWHHHAHIVAGMLTHGWLDREVLGIAWDGTGLGPDGTTWGGEALRSTDRHFQRVARFRPFALPGGDRAITDLRRLGISVLSQVDEIDLPELSSLVRMPEADVRQIQKLLDSSFSPITTSCGRLFDVAALLILNQVESAYEGHAAMCLEAVCDPAECGAYSFPITGTEPLEIDWRPAIKSLLIDRSAGVRPSVMAMRFHRGLAHVIRELADRFPSLPVVLGGGVFQNRVLVEVLVDDWPQDGPPIGVPGMIPPNDGGLAAGQLAILMAVHELQKG
jgi:hydrogenase maturation protein HypF